MLLDHEETGTSVDFVKLSQTVSRFNNFQFTEFIRNIMQLKITHQTKEFYLKLSFLDRARNNKVMVDKLVEPNDPSTVLTEKSDIAAALHKKYLKMFSGNSDTKTVYPIEGDLVEFGIEDARRAIKQISTNKAISWDLIPDNIISYARECETTLRSMHDIL